MGIIVSLPYSFGAMAYQTPVLGKMAYFLPDSCFGCCLWFIDRTDNYSVIFKAKHTQEALIL